MNSIATVRAAVRSRLALIAAGLFVLLGSFAVTAPAQAGYYGGYDPCSYRCSGYYRPYRYYAPYRSYHRCWSCGSGVVYERRYIEREFVERRYGFGGYRRPWGYYRRPCGYSPCGGYYRPSGYGYGYGGYGYGGVGRRWPLPYVDASGPYAEGYDGPPRPPAPVYDQGEY